MRPAMDASGKAARSVSTPGPNARISRLPLPPGTPRDHVAANANISYKAIAIRPDTAEAYYNRGLALRAKGALERAIGLVR